jgi:hypothetical protein
MRQLRQLPSNWDTTARALYGHANSRGPRLCAYHESPTGSAAAVRAMSFKDTSRTSSEEVASTAPVSPDFSR